MRTLVAATLLAASQSTAAPTFTTLASSSFADALPGSDGVLGTEDDQDSAGVNPGGTASYVEFRNVDPGAGSDFHAFIGGGIDFDGPLKVHEGTAVVSHFTGSFVLDQTNGSSATSSIRVDRDRSIHAAFTGSIEAKYTLETCLDQSPDLCLETDIAASGFLLPRGVDPALLRGLDGGEEAYLRRLVADTPANWTALALAVTEPTLLTNVNARGSLAQSFVGGTLRGVMVLVTSDPLTIPLSEFDGEIRQVSIFPSAEIGETRIGTIRMDSSSGDDLRVSPGGATVIMPGASLSATPIRTNGPRRVDPASGRPLVAGASASATCVGGTEPYCWHPGDASDGNEVAYEDLCALSVGFSRFDPNACSLDVFNSTSNAVTGEPVAPDDVITDYEFSISELLVNAVVGNPGAAKLISQGLAGTYVPFVALNQDPCDGFRSDCVTPAPPGSWVLRFAGGTANVTLSAQQQALLGCGEFYETNCEATGPGVFHSEAGALLQSFPLLEDWDTTDPMRPQPGTVGYLSGPLATRFVEGELIGVAGARGPADPLYDPNLDGTNANLFHPLLSSFERFRSEMAAVSFNLLMLLVASSSAEEPLQPGAYEFDPGNTLRADGCSFRKPLLCWAVRGFLAHAVAELPGHPGGPPMARWSWESGVEYLVDEAVGELAGFLGWRLHAFGPESLRVPGRFGVSLFLAPPQRPTFVPTSVLLARGSGPDRVIGTLDDPVAGVAYAVPEPPSDLLWGVCLGLIVGIASRGNRVDRRRAGCCVEVRGA